MSGARIGFARVLALGVCLALALLLLAAREAHAGRYNVAQCGWYVDHGASWWDSTGGAKFRPDAWCVTPAGSDPFDGAHMKSFTRNESTVSGTRFARWRWEAPPGTAITRVSGTWWQVLHDGMQQRIGVGTWGGGFDALATASGTNTAPRNFVFGVDPPQPALEDRLLCAKPESSHCSLDPGSWSSLRAVTITVQDDVGPGAWVWDELTAGGWRRGGQRVMFSGIDDGSGVRFGETLLDGNRIWLHEYPCAMAMISGEWRGTRMQPCGRHGADGAMIDTTRFSDGSHSLRHCTTDFSGNVGCTGDQIVAIDNNPPAHPRNLTLAGGSGWRRVNDFDFAWANPDQGPASPIGAALWRIVGPGGFDTGVKLAAGRDIAAIADRFLPSPGVFSFQVWLRDEAGNENPNTVVEVPMRLDDVAPRVAFEPVAEVTAAELPEAVAAEVHDEHSGPAVGEILYRRLNSDRWVELPTKLRPGDKAASARLVATLPETLGPGTYVFRADVGDGAGNAASTTRRADGGEMALRKTPPPVAPGHAARPGEDARAGEAKRAKTRLFARLRWRGRRGPAVTVPFGAGARLSGRLLSAAGAALPGRELRVVSRPSRGSLAERQVETARTGSHGGFALTLAGGPSRRLTVVYRGEPGLAASRRPALALRVRAGLQLHVAPRALRTGARVRFWGRVRTRGAALPRRGKLIAIQYYESAARRWRPVMVTRSDHSGRFRAAYRFRYVTGSAAIRLRAVALAEERWPYVPGASESVLVRVSGDR